MHLIPYFFTRFGLKISNGFALMPFIMLLYRIIYTSLRGLYILKIMHLNAVQRKGYSYPHLYSNLAQLPLVHVII